ncbi:MAG: hypothetical protein AAEJ52_10000 [Myxococcota bacterium]
MNDLLDNRLYRTGVLTVFLALAWAPLLGGLVGVGSDVAPVEFRRPAASPRFPDSWKSLRDLPGDMEAYLEDGFGFRAQLVTANSLLHLAIGVSASDRYLVGRDGWFFNRKADNVLAQYRGIDAFETDELDAWIETMRRRRAWLAQRGIDFLVVIAPMKQAIYPEFLPEWVNVVGPTRYEQLRARVDNLDLDVLDLHEPLWSARRRGLYYKTDDHWNDLGAFVVYQEIARWIRARHPGVRVLRRADLSLTWSEIGIGNITRGLNLVTLETERVPILEPRLPSAVVSKDEFVSASLNRVERVRTNLRGQPKILFIRDSYATHVARFLSETVSETLLMHHREGRFDRALIEEHEPDVVIYEMVERGLRWKLEP